MSETDLVNACKQYLTLKHIDWWRNNSGGLESKQGHFVRFGAVGSPDIFALVNNKLVGIECKVGKNKQSEHQKEFEKMLKRNGQEYWLIYSIEELVLKIT